MNRRFQSNTHKYCPDCGDLCPREEFYVIASRYDGLSSYCKEHQLERDRAARNKNRQAYRAYARKYMQQKREEAESVSVYTVRKEEGLDRPASLAPMFARPLFGQYCGVCGCGLYRYEEPWGLCMKHKRAHIAPMDQPAAPMMAGD